MREEMNRSQLFASIFILRKSSFPFFPKLLIDNEAALKMQKRKGHCIPYNRVVIRKEMVEFRSE
jgi:hypothetical protein